MISSERLFVYVKVLDVTFREYPSLSLLRQHRAVPDVQFDFLRSRYECYSCNIYIRVTEGLAEMYVDIDNASTEFER